MSPEQGSSTSTSRRRPADAVVTVSVFVKLPRPGFVKTRLAAGVGDEAAAAFYRACAERTVDVVCRCDDEEEEEVDQSLFSFSFFCYLSLSLSFSTSTCE